MAREQDWCLECGNAATTRVLPPPSWRLPALVVLVSLALLGAVVAVTIDAVSDDAERAVDEPAAATTATSARGAPAQRSRRRVAPASARRRAATPARERATARTTPAATATVPGAAEAAGRGAVPRWPRDREAYTVVVVTTDRRGAERRARELIAEGEDAGVLRTDDFDFFSPGGWVAWAGEHPDKPRAQRAAQRLARAYPGAYATLVRPRR
jgi:hypothetical protein